MMLRVANPPVCPILWDLVMPWLAPAIARYPDKAAGDVMAMVERGEAQLWTAWAGNACRAALVTTRHGDTLHLWLCGGLGCDWAGLLRRIMTFARGQGVARWSVDGRKGWLRVLREVA